MSCCKNLGNNAANDFTKKKKVIKKLLFSFKINLGKKKNYFIE